MDGKILSFTMDIHFEAKKLLKIVKIIACSLKFVITLLAMIIGGIKGVFVPL